jgi:hypothetical protein
MPVLYTYGEVGWYACNFLSPDSYQSVFRKCSEHIALKNKILNLELDYMILNSGALHNY